jgi:hypothetical protein
MGIVALTQVSASNEMDKREAIRAQNLSNASQTCSVREQRAWCHQGTRHAQHGAEAANNQLIAKHVYA